MVEKRGADGSPTTIMCFSRRVAEPLARSSPLLDMNDVSQRADGSGDPVHVLRPFVAVCMCNRRAWGSGH